MTGVETLLQAASLLRELAEDATPGPWSAQHIPESAVANQHIIERWFVMGCFDGNPRNPTGPAALSEDKPDAEYIATMQPAVGLDLAEWLADHANAADTLGIDPDPHALTLARRVLGEPT